MARKVTPLTATKCSNAKPKDKEYSLFDGDGLILLIRSSGTKTWRYKYKNDSGAKNVITLGAYPALGLGDARVKRAEFQAMLAKGVDPKEQLEINKARNSKSNTLESIARAWLDVYAIKKPLADDYKLKRLRRLENHLFSKFKNKPIHKISLAELRTALNHIWEHSRDNAQRMRADLVLIYDYAKQHNHIEINIARELAEMDLRTPKAEVKNRATLKALNQIPILIQRIKNDSGHPLTKLCLLLALHIFIRSSEIRFARWSEIDFEEKLWTISARRIPIDGIKHSGRGMKMKSEHNIPLSDQAIEILKEVQKYSGKSDLIFPSVKGKGVLSPRTPNNALRRMGYGKDELCLHGFRALARSALGEMSLYLKEALEKQMSHTEKDKKVNAYTHIAEYLEERREIMQVWSNWLDRIEIDEYITPRAYGLELQAQRFSKLSGE